MKASKRRIIDEEEDEDEDTAERRSQLKGKQKVVDDAVGKASSERRSQQERKRRAVDVRITAADVGPLLNKARSYAMANALAEREAEILSVVDRQDALAASTKKYYQRYQAYWVVSLSLNESAVINLSGCTEPMTPLTSILLAYIIELVPTQKVSQ